MPASQPALLILFIALADLFIVFVYCIIAAISARNVASALYELRQFLASMERLPRRQLIRRQSVDQMDTIAMPKIHMPRE